MKPKVDHKLYETYPIGMVVTIGREFGGKIGTLGVVYEHYQLGRDHFGISIINEFGTYDGFCIEDLEIWEVNPVRIENSVSSYEWKNVTKLLIDFQAGFFRKAFLRPR